jgi:hypothetical protein
VAQTATRHEAVSAAVIRLAYHAEKPAKGTGITACSSTSSTACSGDRLAGRHRIGRPQGDRDSGARDVAALGGVEQSVDGRKFGGLSRVAQWSGRAEVFDVSSGRVAVTREPR